jgi:drug/metabolite transporter (DMT)-like permease
MLYLVIATTIFTLFLYQKSSQILGPKKLMAYIYLSPAFVALISYLSKGITISFGVIVGISISLLATIIILKEDKI